ncbi:hypothetical protein V8E55_012051 [Tylopilus felleus]
MAARTNDRYRVYTRYGRMDVYFDCRLSLGRAADVAAKPIHGSDDSEEIQMFEKRLEEAKVWEATVKELEEALQVRRGAELSGVR